MNKHFLDLADHAAKKSTCLRRKVGAVIVKNTTVVISNGCNGAPEGTPTCSETGCLREQLNVPSGQRHELCRGVHAEQLAINKCAQHGFSLDGAELYCTTYPCSMCAKSIITSGIKTVYYKEGYPDELTAELFKHTNIKLIHME